MQRKLSLFACQIGFVRRLDYFFSDQSKPIPHDYYLNKQWPGALSWNDDLFVHLGMSDGAFTEKVNCIRKRHLALVSKQMLNYYLHCSPYTF